MKSSLFLSLCLLVAVSCSSDGYLSGFKGKEAGKVKTADNEFTFNGYTNHWQDVFQHRYRYGNLYRINVTDVDKAIAASKFELAASLGIPGLQMQEGFFNELADGNFSVVENPSADDIKNAFNSNEKVFVLVDKDSDVAASLAKKNPVAKSTLNSYRAKLEGMNAFDAFVLENGKKTLCVAIGEASELAAFKKIVDGAVKVVGSYDMKRGWFGTATNIQSVTCTPGTPIDVMGAGMNEGNSWFVFSGGYETHSKDKIANWVKETGMPIVTDLGASPLYGCDDWDDFQSQLMSGRDSWFQLKARKNGYIFKAAGPAKGQFDRTSDDDYDGFFAAVGNAKRINETDKPFVITTGNLLGGASNSMILFSNKGENFDRAAMWAAIMDRRSVAIGENGTVMGSDLFRQSIQLMMLDREYIEEYYGDKVDMVATVEGTELVLSIANNYLDDINGTLSFKLPAQVALKDSPASTIRIPAGATKELRIDLNPAPEAMGRLSALGIEFDWGSSSKAIFAKLDMPLAVSSHQLLYGSETGTVFPVALYNFTNDNNVNVKVTVADKNDPSKVVFNDEQTVSIAKGTAKKMSYDIKVPAGSYLVKTEAMGVCAETQLGIGNDAGTVTLKEVDFNGDGVNEYVMENNKVRVALLTTGARVIEYYVKSKDDNVFFKLWPDNPEDINRPNRDWAFWPFGGFEDFLGQASMETHKVYSAEIVKNGGNYAEVKMTANYYGNVITKTFSLYGDTPLLGIRFELDMVNPELDIIGPQPMVAIGKNHGPEDDFIIPEVGGIQKYQMDPRRMWGKILDLSEGWNGAYDTKENISFIGAYPVNRPFYLHMWMNLDTNEDSHYPYCELQPWVPMYHNSTSFFSYYMWADGSSWTESLAELRDRNLITAR